MGVKRAVILIGILGDENAVEFLAVPSSGRGHLTLTPLSGTDSSGALTSVHMLEFGRAEIEAMLLLLIEE